MTLYHGNRKIHDLDTRGLYIGNRPIKQLYHGSTLVFQQKITVTRTLTYYGSQGASVSGENFWDSTIGVYNRTATGSITVDSITTTVLVKGALK